ncbi:MAG: crossover junction endodeoxyribonuclease RuvC [Dehalococcoidia bacterium]
MPTLVLGIDPGIASMGYGLIEDNDGELKSIEYGCLTTTAKQATTERLRTLYQGLIAIMERQQPAEVAVELFVARNLRTALTVGQARGVAILAAANKEIPVFEYGPLEVKQMVSGYGRGDKRQIQEMVRIQLGLESIPEPDHAADALATAICHINAARMSRLLASSQ